MKQLLGLLLVVLLLAGCSADPPAVTDPAPQPPETTETTLPETTVPETTVPETTQVAGQVVRVEQTYTGASIDSPDNATILTGYDRQDQMVWQWTSDVVSNDGQICMLTEFAESADLVFVVVNNKLIALNRETGRPSLEIPGMSGANGIAVDGNGVVYVTEYFSGNVVAYNRNGVKVLDLYEAVPQLAELVYWGYGPEYLGQNVMKFCFEACSDEAAVTEYCHVGQNVHGWDYWYVLLDTTTMTLILPN